MFGRKKENPREHRYYLLPGMGKLNKQKRKKIFRWSVLFGIFVSALFGLFLYWINRI